MFLSGICNIFIWFYDGVRFFNNYNESSDKMLQNLNYILSSAFVVIYKLYLECRK